jgi:hypothetical protein
VLHQLNIVVNNLQAPQHHSNNQHGDQALSANRAVKHFQQQNAMLPAAE